MWPLWLAYCNEKAGTSLTGEDVNFDYNLAKFFGDECFDFWAQDNLYDNLEPMEGCVETLTALHEQGWEIGFVSYCKKGHFGSKCAWINKHFPFRSFINVTKEKHGTRCTHFIDDRVHYHNKQHKDVKLILMQTPYTQDEHIKEHIFNRLTIAKNWKTIYDYLQGDVKE